MLEATLEHKLLEVRHVLQGRCKHIALGLILESEAYHLESADLRVELDAVRYLLAHFVLVEIRVVVCQFQFEHTARQLELQFPIKLCQHHMNSLDAEGPEELRNVRIFLHVPVKASLETGILKLLRGLLFHKVDQFV